MHIAAADHFYDKGEIVMAEAVSCGDVDLIKSLVAGGANPNSVSATEMTPLLWACIKERIESVEALLQCGADCNFHAPLHMCAQISWLKGAATLLKAGANPNICAADGDTPLHMAVTRAAANETLDAAEIFRLLLSSGANP